VNTIAVLPCSLSFLRGPRFLYGEIVFHFRFVRQRDVDHWRVNCIIRVHKSRELLGSATSREGDSVGVNGTGSEPVRFEEKEGPRRRDPAVFLQLRLIFRLHRILVPKREGGAARMAGPPVQPGDIPRETAFARRFHVINQHSLSDARLIYVRNDISWGKNYLGCRRRQLILKRA